MGLFGGKSIGGRQKEDPGLLRHSSGWAKLSAHLRSQEGMRILDIGPTSAGNINYLTSLGHSVYMANLVEEANRTGYMRIDPEGEQRYDVQRFVQEHMDFQGRRFDVVALWDTADYLPEELLQPVVDRLHEVLEPGGQLLAFFRSKATGDEMVFSRYHLTDGEQVRLQRVGGHAVRCTYTNRQVEAIFSKFSAHKFFLAKDSLREVLVSR